MSERIGRFVFYTPEEAKQHGLTTPSAEEIARTQAAFEAFNAQARDSAPTAQSPSLGLGERWGVDDQDDDTKFAGWTQDPTTGEWRDADGRPAHDAHGRRIQYHDDDVENDR